MKKYYVLILAAIALTVITGCRNTDDGDSSAVVLTLDYLQNHNPVIPANVSDDLEKSAMDGAFYLMNASHSCRLYKNSGPVISLLTNFSNYFLNYESGMFDNAELCMSVLALENCAELVCRHNKTLKENCKLAASRLRAKIGKDYWLLKYMDNRIKDINGADRQQLEELIKKTDLNRAAADADRAVFRRCIILSYVHYCYMTSGVKPPDVLIQFGCDCRRLLKKGRIKVSPDNDIYWRLIVGFSGFDTFGQWMGYLPVESQWVRSLYN